MENIQRLIVEYREWFYLITVFWTFFEGETFVLLAAAAAANGLLDPIMLAIAAWSGSYLGDQTWFFLGRKCGPLLLRRYPQWQPSIDKVHRWLDHWDTIFILSFRFIYGIRNFSSVAMGLSELGVARFMILNFISAGIWAITFVSVGYLCGNAVDGLLGEWAETFELVALGVFLCLLVAFIFLARWRSRVNARQRAALGALNPAPKSHS